MALTRFNGSLSSAVAPRRRKSSASRRRAGTRAVRAFRARVAQELADRPQVLDALADRVDGHDDRDAEQKAPHTPQPAPEQQAHEHHDRVEPADLLREPGHEEE